MKTNLVEDTGHVLLLLGWVREQGQEAAALLEQRHALSSLRKRVRILEEIRIFD